MAWGESFEQAYIASDEDEAKDKLHKDYPYCDTFSFTERNDVRGIWKNKKTGNRYLVTGTSIDDDDGDVMVQYEASEKYCMKIDEFLEKFEFIEGL